MQSLRQAKAVLHVTLISGRFSFFSQLWLHKKKLVKTQNWEKGGVGNIFQKLKLGTSKAQNEIVPAIKKSILEDLSKIPPSEVPPPSGRRG